MITVDNRIRSIGYNGQAPGEPHCAGELCPGTTPGNCPTIHAELNAFNWLPHSLLAETVPKDLYVTQSPCKNCFYHAMEFGMKRLFFQFLYRVNDHLNCYSETEIYQVMPGGYLINWNTKKLERAIEFK